jgi:starvation-inducible outer membrane lipoprotein
MNQSKRIVKILIIGTMMFGISGCRSANTNINQTELKTELKAMTWTTLQINKSWNNEKSYALVGSDINTNPYIGDTLITEALPILCIKKQDLAKPDFISPHLTPGGRCSWYLVGRIYWFNTTNSRD